MQLQWHQVACSGTIFSNRRQSLKIAPSEVYTACLEDRPARLMRQEVCRFSQLVTYMARLMTEQRLSEMHHASTCTSISDIFMAISTEMASFIIFVERPNSSAVSSILPYSLTNYSRQL